MIPVLLTPVETQHLLAERFKALRLQARLKRSTMAKRSGVTESSLKRFENTGEISLKNLLRLSHAIDRLQEFEELFHPLEATSMAELKCLLFVKSLREDVFSTPQGGTQFSAPLWGISTLWVLVDFRFKIEYRFSCFFITVFQE